MTPPPHTERDAVGFSLVTSINCFWRPYLKRCGLRQAFPLLIPPRPYCADYLPGRLLIRSRTSALRRRHIHRTRNRLTVSGLAAIGVVVFGDGADRQPLQIITTTPRHVESFGVRERRCRPSRPTALIPFIAYAGVCGTGSRAAEGRPTGSGVPNRCRLARINARPQNLTAGGNFETSMYHSKLGLEWPPKAAVSC